ncbi:MAG: NapC/NirT family cytochrome c [Phycisphaeraceae bacterium]|nr:NapC/NirT family cytochrome c [Phycisphaeraceae bacterium]MCB9848649.1 NapC/NirT family cytochrome c [Phycisphaeraceae bacterium]
MRKLWRWLWADKRRRRGVIAIGVVFFLVGSVVGVEHTSQPHFCNSCHIMEPYYASWETSAHHDISCVKCHIEPGAQSFVAAKLNGLGQVVDDILHRTSFKPSASVTQLSCTRSGCHSVETLNGKKIDNGVFKFRHDKHLGQSHLGVAISCGTCHSHVMGDQHFEVNTSVCITCHLIESEHNGDPHLVMASNGLSASKIQFRVRAGFSAAQLEQNGQAHRPPSNCTNCHDAPSTIIEYQGLQVNHAEFIARGASCESCHRNATAPPPAIENGSCVQCHNFGVEKTLPAEEMHRIHALGEHKIECFSCHGLIGHGISAQTMSLEQFDCTRCHINQHSIQRTEYLHAPQTADAQDAILGQNPINPMFLAHVDCTGCHIAEHAKSDNPSDKSRIVTASAESCDRCHQPGMGAQMIPLWQGTTRRLYEQLQSKLDRIDSGSLDPQSQDLIREARQLVDLVRLDGSWGVHNPSYTQQLLERALELVRQAQQGAPIEG